VAFFGPAAAAASAVGAAVAAAIGTKCVMPFRSSQHVLKQQLPSPPPLHVLAVSQPHTHLHVLPKTTLLPGGSGFAVGIPTCTGAGAGVVVGGKYALAGTASFWNIEPSPQLGKLIVHTHSVPDSDAASQEPIMSVRGLHSAVALWPKSFTSNMLSAHVPPSDSRNSSVEPPAPTWHCMVPTFTFVAFVEPWNPSTGLAAHVESDFSQVRSTSSSSWSHSRRELSTVMQTLNWHPKKGPGQAGAET